MGKRYRVKKKYEFSRVFRQGRSIHGKYLIVYFRENHRSYNRLGVTVMKGFGNSVRRNHAKRLLREAYRLQLPQMKTGYDFILLCRKRNKKPVYNQVYQDLAQMFTKTNMWLKE